MVTKKKSPKFAQPFAALPQGTAEWLAARKGRITASLAAACLGWNPWVSPQSVYRQILGLETKDMTWHMQTGREFEAVAVSEYENQHGKICLPTGLWLCPYEEWLAASPDRLIGKDGILEIKCSVKVPTRLPLHIRIQCQVQLICTQRQWCDCAYFSGGLAAVFRVVPSGQRGLIGRLLAFKQKYLDTGTQPKKGEIKRWVFPEPTKAK